MWWWGNRMPCNTCAHCSGDIQGFDRQLYYAIFAKVTKYDANALPDNKQKTLSDKEFTSSQLSITITMVCPMLSISSSSEI